MDFRKNYIGIDVSKDKLNFAYPQGEKSWNEGEVPNDRASIEKWLSTAALPESPHFVIEATGTYSLWPEKCLRAAGFPVSVLNPMQSSGYAKVEQGISKTDKGDARLLSRYGASIAPAPSAEKGAEERARAQWLNHIGHLNGEKTCKSNRLHAMSYDPDAVPGIVSKLEGDILRIEAEIEGAEAELDKLVGSEYGGELALALTVVGIGPKTARKIMCYGGGFRGFGHVKPLLKMFGLAVVKRESGGTRSKGAICRTGNPDLRASLYMAGWAAIKYNKGCMALYKRLREKGKAHKVAMIAVCQKLVRQVFGVVKSGVPFDNDFQEKLAIAK